MVAAGGGEAQLLVISKSQLLVTRDHRRIPKPSDVPKIEITRGC